MYQSHFTIEPDNDLQFGAVLYHIYSIRTLLKENFRISGSPTNHLFIYCVFCRGYRWSTEYFLGRTETFVCDTCRNAAETTILKLV